jgi:putrescine aminotransferase
MKGAFLMRELKKLQKKHEEIMVDVHGKGLLIGMDFTTNDIGYAVAAGLFKRGILVAGTLISAQTIRVEPALNVPDKYIMIFLEKLDDVLGEIAAKHRRRKK